MKGIVSPSAMTPHSKKGFTLIELPAMRNLRPCSGRAGFTLIELLVVVTIIVVLLAMLVPAMDKAIYQVMLVKCGTNQRMTATTVLQYAFGNKRHYPRRPDVQDGDGNGPSAWAVYMAPGQTMPTGFDMRPIVRDGLGLNVNTTFQCPLIEHIDLEARLPDEFVYGNTALWFGWHYFKTNGGTRYAGMYKMGDRFEHNKKKYSLLVSDLDLERPPPVGSQTSHPDQGAGRMFNAVFIRVNVVANVAAPHTASFWQDPSGNRGTVDQNYTYDDGSVRRVDQLKERDTRMDDLPGKYNAQSDFTQVPSQQ